MSRAIEAAFIMKQGMTLPILVVRLEDGAGHNVDLTEVAEARLRLRHTVTGEVAVDAVAEVLGAEDGPEPFPCLVRYVWPTIQGFPLGYYRGEWILTWTDGNIESFPSDGYFFVLIIAALGTT